ncbi:hypothetical protein Tco_0256956 [Tanacetum coccineum]
MKLLAGNSPIFLVNSECLGNTKAFVKGSAKLSSVSIFSILTSPILMVFSENSELLRENSLHPIVTPSSFRNCYGSTSEDAVAKILVLYFTPVKAAPPFKTTISSLATLGVEALCDLLNLMLFLALGSFSRLEFHIKSFQDFLNGLAHAISRIGGSYQPLDWNILRMRAADSRAKSQKDFGRSGDGNNRNAPLDDQKL